MNVEAHSQWNFLLEEEENQWRRGHLQFDNDESDANIQLTLLEQCPNVSNLHGYFSNLESRKCCLKLAAVNTTFSTMRLVTESSSSGSIAKVSQQQNKIENGRLSDKDFWVYRRALFGANFPVLSVPDPPSDASPLLEPRATTPDHHKHMSLTVPYTGTSCNTSPKPPTSPEQIFDNIKNRFQRSFSDIRSSSNSLTSGVESMDSEAYIPKNHDNDEIAVLPAEVLADWHRKVFGLSVEVSRVYEKKIYEPYRKRTFAKILVEELCRQLSLLENDSHPFYNSRVFLSREAYGRWQQRERSRIGHMISKFWHNSLPPVKSSTHLDVAQYHEDYKSYLHKIVAFECQMRKSNGSCDVGPLLSSVSKRLLKEFTLRYGIGDLYQKIAYLELLGDGFSSTPGYIQQVIGELTELKHVLPKKMAKSVLVVAEHEMLTRVLNVLQGHCKNILTRIKRIYDNSEIMIGVGGMIHLLALVVELMGQLDVDNSPTLKQLLQLYTKENLHSSYERHKIIAMNDLEIDPRSVEITPKLINRLVLNIKDEVLDYQRSYAPAYQRYLDVVKFAGQVLYDLLMEDVTNFCVTTCKKREHLGIDLPVLGVVYRLDQLDREWADIVTTTQQVWRKEFYTHALHWVKMLENHAQKFVLQSVGSDNFGQVVVPDVVDNVGDNLLPASRCTSTNSQVSLTQSQYSAFSAVRSYRSLQIPIPSLHMPEDSVSIPVQSDDNDNTSQHSHSFSNNILKNNQTDHVKAKTEDILTFQVDAKTKRSETPSSCLSTNRFHTLRCKSEPRFNVHFKDKIEEFDISRSCDESCLADTGYFTHTATDIDPDSPGKIENPDKLLHNQHNPDVAQHLGGGTQTVHTPDIISDIHIPATGGVGCSNISAIESTDMHLGITAVEFNQKCNGDYNVSGAVDNEDVDSLAGEVCGHLAESTPLKPSTREYLTHPSIPDHVYNTTSPAFNIDISNSSHEPIVGDSSVKIPETKSMPNIKTKSVPGLPNRERIDSHMIEGDMSEENEGVCESPFLVSTSAIEVIFLIKRMINSVKTFCDTLYPLKMLSASVCDMNEDLVLHLKQSVIMRWKLIETMVENIGNIVRLYSYNLLCVDLCGETNCVAKKIVGAQLVEEVKRLYQHKLLWGCRHRMKKQPCNMYSKKKVRYLADKFEPISKEMCTRINNLMELNGDLEDLFTMARESLSLDQTVQAAAKFHLVLEDETESLCQLAKDGLWEISKGLLNIMVYRMNLFTSEALIILHQLQVPRYLAMETIYKPVINFLRNHALMLKEWTHDIAYTELTKRWWKTLVQLLEDLVKHLIHKESMTVVTAKRLLQLIANLMRFLCGRHVQLDLDFAESRIEECIDTLNMCTIPTLHLIVIHHILTTDLDSSVSSESGLPPSWYIQNMYRDLHHQRKCFTGSQIVNWILTHPVNTTDTGFPGNSSSNISPITPASKHRSRGPEIESSVFDLREALQVADNLLTCGAIKTVDWTPLSSPAGSVNENVYPDIVHYSTSSIPNIGESSREAKSAMGFSYGKAYGSWSVRNDHPDLLQQQRISTLKRITSAPQFSLGLSSPIDVEMLKNELQKQMQGKLYDFDSSDDSHEETLINSTSTADNHGTEDHDHKNKPGIDDNDVYDFNVKIGDVDVNIDHHSQIASDSDSVSSSSTLKDEEDVIANDNKNMPPVFNISEISASSPLKKPAVGIEAQNPLRLHDYTVSSDSTGFSSSMSSGAFQNSDANYYCFTDGADQVLPFMNHMMEHLDAGFEDLLTEQIQQLKRENYCFGFQYVIQNIKPDFILKILNSRRHQDELARKFLIPTQQSSEFGLLGFEGGGSCFGFF